MNWMCKLCMCVNSYTCRENLFIFYSHQQTVQAVVFSW
jgi:hypothetical protein